MLKRLSFSLLVVGIAGCQVGGIPSNAEWVNIKTPGADRHADRIECHGEAIKAFPATAKTVGGSGVQSSCTGAGYTTSCTSTGGTIVMDADSVKREGTERSCMRARGWRPMVNGVDADPDK